MQKKEESNRRIIDAGFKCFALNGYKKTSVDDIAQSAGVSKALIFHYYGSKDGLYSYLLNYYIDTVTDGLQSFDGLYKTDFFERLEAFSEAKLRILQKNAALFDFSMSLANDKDQKVIDFSQPGSDASKYFDGVDMSRFKDGIELDYMIKIIFWCSAGFIKDADMSKSNVGDVMKEFKKFTDVLKKVFYKEN
ncbi:MAG: TetR/AcrR family transcriptional regulator [Clostridiales bacterium]|nr:TetR/AcrR family transcriptional regulator [Clostridiales bacterium]